MRSVLKRIAIPLALVGLLFGPAAAHAASPFAGIPVSGTSRDGNVFSGTMDILGFVNQGANVNAIASLTGTITPARGAAQEVTGAIVLVPVNVPATARGIGGSMNELSTQGPSAQQATTCPILHLDLGPLDLNLLGLQVHLNEVVLDITAQGGSGQLLGNLLCGVANLLNGFNVGNILGNALGTTLSQLLNNLLMSLGL
jgi:hypothetical protein